MSKIHAHINDTETPEAVRNLMQEFVKDFESRSSDVWIREVKNRDSEHHRKTLLKQGRCDFDKPTHGLTSEELICLYNYYYFPMHFQSSYWLFEHFYNIGLAQHFINNCNPIFIDFGCGTLSSSIAFSAVRRKFEKNDIFRESNYFFDTPTSFILFDISSKLVAEINKAINYKYYGSLTDNAIWTYYDTFDTTAYAYSIKWSISNLINNKRRWLYSAENESFYYYTDLKHIEYSLILNFSYLFASISLNVNELIKFINEIILKHNNNNIVVFFQNPDLDELNTKWEEFKEKVPLSSIAKGVAPIKHYGNSKVRYEVLFKSKFDDVFSDVEIFIKKQQPI